MNTQIKNPIKKPKITEKASFLAEQNVYTFDIRAGANKTEIKKAIFTLYKVKPIRVNVLPVTKKTVMRGREKEGKRGGGRKALVYLKKGDKIEFI